MRAGSKSTASRARAPPSMFFSPPTNSLSRPKRRKSPRTRPSPAAPKPFSLSKTRPSCAKWPATFSRIAVTACSKRPAARRRSNCGANCASEIDMLLTDMVMPEGISGVDLAERLLADRPDLKIIFTSGYSSTEINAELLSRSQARFLQKPYSHTTLARVVRECLDRTGVKSLTPHGNPRARRHDHRHCQRHPFRRPRRTRRQRRLRASHHRQSPAPRQSRAPTGI